MASKKIMIGDKKVAFKATAATPVYYRELFHREFMSDIKNLSEDFGKREEDDLPIESLEIFLDIAYCMARQADSAILEKMDWLDQFDIFSIYEILPTIIELWGMNQKTMVDAKKK